MKKQFISLYTAVALLITCISIPLTASAASTQSFEQNFSEVTAQTYTDTTAFENATGLILGDEPAESTIAVTSDGYLDLVIGNWKGLNVDYKLATAVKKGELTMSLKYRPKDGEAPGSFNFLGLPATNGSADANTPIRQDSSKTFYETTMTNTLAAQPSLATDGWYHLRAVYSSESATADWTVKMYDDSATEAVLLTSGSVTRSDYASLETLRLFRGFGYGGFSAQLDDLKVSWKANTATNNNFTQDFSEVTAQTYTDATAFETATGLVLGDAPASSTITVTSDKYLALTIGNWAGLNIDYKLNTAVSKGQLTMSMKYGVAEGQKPGSHNFLGFPDTTTTTDAYTPIRQDSRGTFFETTMGCTLSGQPAKDSDGWYHLRAVYSRASTEKDWDVKVYDDSAAEAVLIASGTLSKSNYSTLETLRLFRAFGYDGFSALLDDISVSYQEKISEQPSEPSKPTNNNFTQDFSEVTAQTYTDATAFETATGLVLGDAPASSTITVTGDKYLALTIGNWAGLNIDYKLNTAVSKGQLTMSMKYGVAEGEKPGSHNFLGFPDTTTTTDAYTPIRQDSRGTFFETTMGCTLLGQPAKDSDGWYHLRAVYSRASTEKDWDVKVYDDSAAEAVLIASGTLSKSNYSTLETLRLFRAFGYDGFSALIDDISVSYQEKISAQPSDLSSFTQNFENVTAGEYTAEELKEATALTAKPGSGKAEMGTAEVKTEGENSYLYLKASGAWPDEKMVLLNYELPKTISKGALTVSMKYGEDSSTPAGANHLFEFPDGGEETSVIQKMADGWLNGALGFATLTTPTEKSGWYSLRMVVSRASESDDWNVKLYDDNVETPALVANGTLEKAKYATLSAVRFIRLYPYPSLSAALIDDIAVTYSETVPSEPGQKEISLEVDYTSESLTQGNYSNTQLEEKTPGISYAATGKYDISDEGNGQMLIFSPKAVYNGASVTWMPQDAVKSGKIDIDISLSASDGDLARNLFILNPDATTEARLFMIPKAGTGILQSDHSKAVVGTFSAPPKKDAKGFWNLRLSMSRVSEDSAWDVALYDASESLETPVYTASIAADKLKDISKIHLLEAYSMSEADTKESISVKKISIHVKDFPKVTDSTGKDMAPNAESFELSFSDEVNTEQLTVKLIQADDKNVVIETTVSFDEDTGKLTVTPESYLDYGTEYTVNFIGASVQPYSFTTAKAPLTVTAKTLSYKQDGSSSETMPDGTFDAQCDVTITRSSNTSEVLLVLVAYDEKGAVQKLKTATVAGADVSGTVTLEDLTKETANNISCYVWEKTADGYHSVSNDE